MPDRISVVIPTFNRREVLLTTLAALAELAPPQPVEIIVVDDGSSDGTADAVRALRHPHPLRVIVQENGGAASARNRGAAAASGSVLLFLDDDMIADPGMVTAHLVALKTADAAVGHIPLAESSPPSFLADGLGRWAQRRHSRLTKPGAEVQVSDLLTGQLSVRKHVFDALNGFDEAFTAGGSFGAEDTDFLYRLTQSGAVVAYAADAISFQHYVVTPTQYLRQWTQAGRANAILVRKHSDLRTSIVGAPFSRLAAGRWLAAVCRHVPDAMSRPVSGAILGRASLGRGGVLTRSMFAALRDVRYWRSFVEYDADRLVILAYHAVDVVDDPVLSPYSVTPRSFSDQIDALIDDGYQWVSLPDVLRHLQGDRLRGRNLVLTFDDGYRSLLPGTVAFLQQRNIPASVFVVTSELGGTNEWDASRGAARLPLLDADELRRMAELGWTIGSHTRTHAHLPRLSASELELELAGSLRDLAAERIPAVPVVAYPHGEHDRRSRRAARRAGYSAALALVGPRATARVRSRFALPRIEVGSATTTEELKRIVARPTRKLAPRVDAEIRGLLRPGLAALTRAVHERSGSPSAGPETSSAPSPDVFVG